MEIHPFHSTLLQYLIRLKIKGDYHIPLTHSDRTTLAINSKNRISESYIHKVLCEKGKRPRSLNPQTLDLIANFADYPDYNAFLRQNPVPDEHYYYLLKPKAAKLLEKIIEQRMAKFKRAKLKASQLKIQFPEG